MTSRIGAGRAAARAAASIVVVLLVGCSSSAGGGTAPTTTIALSLGGLGGSSPATVTGAPSSPTATTLSGAMPAITDPAVAATATPVRLADIEPAVKAVEAALGGPQQYTEINADVQNVNLFVAKPDGTELAYLYTNGTLSPPDGATKQEPGAVPFSLDTVQLDKAAGFQQLLGGKMPGAKIARVVLVRNTVDGFVWHLYVEGAKQSKFIVGIAPDGTTITGLLND